MTVNGRLARGDRVRLARAHSGHHPQLRRLVGREGTVVTHHPTKRKVHVSFDDQGPYFRRWWVGERYLERVEAGVRD